MSMVIVWEVMQVGWIVSNGPPHMEDLLYLQVLIRELLPRVVNLIQLMQIPQKEYEL